jgi:hypothetical protein
MSINSTGVVDVVGTLKTPHIDSSTGQQLIITAGESATYQTGQVLETVYVVAENGFSVTSSPDNWATGWAGRLTCTINAANGQSIFPGTVTAPTFSGALSGNATTATTLATARTINGVSFNGSANITVEPYISSDDTGDINCPIVFSATTTAGYKRLYEDSTLYFNNTSNILYTPLMVATGITAGSYITTADANSGIGFWGGSPSSNYGICMGNTQTDFGWVTDYSMHFNMGSTADRGFTFGSSRTIVKVSIEAATGHFRTAGVIQSDNWGRFLRVGIGVAAHATYDLALPAGGDIYSSGTIYVRSGIFDLRYSAVRFKQLVTPTTSNMQLYELCPGTDAGNYALYYRNAAGALYYVILTAK